MPRIRKKVAELLKKIESTESPGEPSNTSVPGKTRNKKESIQDQNYRKKKKDAIDGKEDKQQRSNETESQGKGRGASDRDSSDKGSKNTGTGPQGQTSLQSGQTTVQFSTGGGFGSLMALFASSASLVRAEIGSILTVSTQTTNLNLQTVLRTINNQTGNSLGDDGRNLREVGRAAEQVYESSGKQFNLDIGSVQATQRSGSSDIFSAILKGISAQAGEGGGKLLDLTKITILSIPFTLTIYEGFNTSTFFFSKTTNFTFPNSPATTTPVFAGDGTTILGFALNNVNLQTVDSYFKDAGLSASNNYLYKVLSPIVSPTTVTSPDQTYGLTVTKGGDLSVSIASAPQIVTDKTIGLTLTPTGDVYANVLNPMSVLVNIQAASGDLTVRLNAGPGKILESANAANNAMLGLKTTGTNEFANTVFRSSGLNTIVGNAYALTLSDSTLSYKGGLSNTQSSFTIPESYTLPSSTIYRHVGTSNETVPTKAAYGNFASFVNPLNPLDITYSTITFADGMSHNLKFGGNVLDVFGTKYGEGDVLNVNLATNPSAANTITMGGNTLAGFGLSYGDLQTLNVSAFTDPHSSTFSTTLLFKGNILWVDKNVDSTLYSHLQNLNLSDHLTANSNLKIIFEDSIIHGNLGADTFYGEIQNLGDLADPTKYNGFITGVVAAEVNGHVVVTPRGLVFVEATTTTDNQGNVITIPAHYETALATNSITWGNDVYSGGFDSDHPSEENINTYNFTLLGTADFLPLPVMQGHDLITDFNLETDSLIFQLTPALFKALDIDHNKVISVSDLNSGLLRYDPEGDYFKVGLIYNRLIGEDVFASTINFKGGGSLSLQGVFASDFNDIKNLTTEVNLTYIPVANLAPDQIVATTPTPTAPYVYGQGPDNLTPSYYNELDNFFANSLFAHYTVEGLPADAAVTIDQYGTITVDTLVPYIVPIIITATDDHGNGVSVTSDPLLFGFLNAPIIAKLDAPLVMPEFGSSSSNILIGGLNATIIGGNQSDFNFIIQGITDTMPPEEPRLSFGSNLIVNTAKSTTAEAYGNFKTILLRAQGNDDISVSADTAIQQFGSINHDIFNFKSNAFYVNGTVFGVATSLQIDALGGNNTVINLSNHYKTPEPIITTGSFDYNTINIGSQVIYGDGTGVLTGNFNQIVINATPGTPLTSDGVQSGFDLPRASGVSGLTGSIDTSSSIQNNFFNFGTTQITILGDSSSQISTINANVHDLIITAKSIYLKSTTPTLTNISTATFADNHFVFGDANLTGGVGSTTYYGHLANFGDPFAYLNYRGFVRGVTVSGDGSHLTITNVKDNNSITWGNTIYTGSLGADTYNFTLIEDVNHFAVMQGFDTITNFDPFKDTIVFNVQTNLYRSLGMGGVTDQPTLAGLLDANVDVSTISGNTIVTFTGPLNSEVPYGKITFLNLANLTGVEFTSLYHLQTYLFSHYGINPITINPTGTLYSAPIVNPEAINTFDPVFVKIDQVQAFEKFVSNADPADLTWGIASGVALPPEISFTANGTLHVFESSDGKAPVDAFIRVTINDGISANIIIPTTPIHIFALNADSGAPFTDASIKGSTATEIYKTSGAIKIVGGGDDITYNPTTNPTTPNTALVYGSKLIYDVSEGGHTAIGDVENINFVNTATTITTPATTIPETETTPAITTHAISNLDGQTITFNANMFNINSGGVGAVFGNAVNLVLSANASNDGQGGLINATIAHNVFNFKPVTIYTVGSTIPAVLGNSFAAYGNIQILSFLLHNPDSSITGAIGNASITGNEFKFSANKLVGSSDTTTLNPGIGILNIENTDTAIHDPLTPNLTPISGNKITFANSILIGGTGSTFFNADIADLSNSSFVLGVVTFRNDADLPVQITDSQNNVITWGNNTYTIQPDSQSSTLTFTLLSLGGVEAAMQGNATVNGFRLDTDTLDTFDTLALKLSPTFFKALNTDYDRSISLAEIDNPLFFDNDTPGKTTLSFAPSLAPSLAAGSIVFMGQSITSFTDFGAGFTTELAYTPAPITVHNPALGLTPQIFLTSYGNGAGVYGNVLDSYFDHIDIGDAGSTYTVTLSAAYPQLAFPDPATLLSATGLFDQYGTATVANAPDSPTLSILNVKPTDVHNLANTVNVDLVVGTFDGVKTVDPNAGAGGTFTGSLTAPSYLQGSFANETLFGNANQLTFSALNQVKSFSGLTNGTDQFGGNLIINTNTGNTAYGVSRVIRLSVDQTDFSTGPQIPDGEAWSVATEFQSTNFNFKPNALYVNGKAFGIADEFLIDVHNSASGMALTGTGYVSATFGSLNGDISRYNFDAQTILGQGTLVGVLNSFRISAIENSAVSLEPLPTSSDVNISANVSYNHFIFAPTEIIALGNQHSTIYTHINSLSFFTHNNFYGSVYGIDGEGNLFYQIKNTSASINNNKFIFKDSIAVGGAGGVDYYSDVNDLSGTSLWASNSVYFDTTGTNITITDTSNNTFTWGNNQLHLSPEANSPDVIHLNLLENQNHGTGLLGNLDVYNFNLVNDSINLNLSSALYKALNGGSTTLNGSLTAASLDNFHPELGSGVSVTPSGADTIIHFNAGSITLHGISGADTLADLSNNVQLGTTLVGNQGLSDSFTIGVPTVFSNFKEVDHIAQFNPNQDILRFALSSTTYAQMSKYGWVPGADLLNAFASDVGSNITITQKPMEYASLDPTNTSAATVDSVLNIGATGSITLHNVDITTLNSPFVQLGQQGTNASDTFYFIAPGNDFSTFTGGTFITGFNNTDALNRDNLEITVSKDLYNTITQNGTLSAAAALSANVANGTGGVIATSSGANTILQFVTNNAVSGTIALEGVNSTLAGLGSHLHLGYIDSATAGVDTFAFNLGGSSFGTFNQFAHITNFDPTQDILRITVPIDLYYTINAGGAFSGQSLYNILTSAASSTSGGIRTISEAAHYPSPQYGTGNSDLVLNFQDLGLSPSGIITLHNVDPSTSLTSLGNHFQFGSTQSGTGDVDTFAFNAPATGATNFSAFQQFNHITGFDLGTDNIDISLSQSLFDSISLNGTLSSEQIANALTNNTSPSLGDINVVSANGSTSLQFVDSSNKIYGSITLDGVTLAPGADINSFGSHLRFGSVQQGTSGADTFIFDHAANGNSQDLSAFKEYDHLIDFDTGADTLAIKITNNLYNAINSQIFGAPSASELVDALATGMADGQSIGTQITVAHTTAQYGTGVDSILQFMSGFGASSVMSGSITLHNVNINSITEIPNLQVIH